MYSLHYFRVVECIKYQSGKVWKITDSWEISTGKGRKTWTWSRGTKRTVKYSLKHQRRIKGKKYCLVLQCSVNPKTVKICSANENWVINKSEDIRPYGVLLIKTENKYKISEI